MVPGDWYDAFLFDLDGVVYRGDEAIPGAAGALQGLRARGRAVVFLTNNSARTPEQVARRLEGLGVDASPQEVVTSAHVTGAMVARMAAQDGGPATAFVVGEQGIREALAHQGIEVLDGDPDRAGFVVVGWDRSADYDKLRAASVLVRRGARLVATNADPTYPAAGGELWPGAGALLAAVEAASGARAVVVGKPHRPLFDAALDRAGTSDALVVGDRVDTDVAGAAGAGLDSALVLTGAHGPADLLDHDAIPTMVVANLGELLRERREARIEPARAEDVQAVRALVREAGLAAEDLTADEATAARTADGLLAACSITVRGEDGYVHSVAVRADARGRHLGSLVVAAAARRAAGRGARALSLLTEGAQGFFAHLGFDRVERRELASWILERTTACSSSAVAMRREVAPPQGGQAGAAGTGRRR